MKRRVGIKLVGQQYEWVTYYYSRFHKAIVGSVAFGFGVKEKSSHADYV